MTVRQCIAAEVCHEWSIRDGHISVAGYRSGMDGEGPDVGGVDRNEKVRRFLTERFDRGAGSVTSLGTGAWSRAYAFECGGRAFVVRFSGLEEDFRKDERAARWSSPALPVPAVVAVGESEAGFYAISERLSGDEIDDRDEAQLRALLPAIFGALDSLRAADVADSTGYGGWGADGDAPYSSWREMLLDVERDRTSQRHHGWRDRLAASPTGAGSFIEAHRRLVDLAPYLTEERHLIHADLLNHNVLVTGARITAVFDWGSAMYGDSLFDVAWFCFWSAWYPAWRAIDFTAEARRHFADIGLRVPSFDERLRACQIFIGLEGQGYQAWKGLWSDLAWTAARTLKVAEGRSRF
jgi:hygromycin-B 4-O-kinase